MSSKVGAPSPVGVRVEDRLDDDRGGTAQGRFAAADDLEVEPLGVELDDHVGLESQPPGEIVEGIHLHRGRFVLRPLTRRGRQKRRQDVVPPMDVQRLLGRCAGQRQLEHVDGAGLGLRPPLEGTAQPGDGFDAVDPGLGEEPPEAARGPALVGPDVDHGADVEVGEAQQLLPLLDVVDEVLQAESLVEKPEELAGPESRWHAGRS